MEMALNELLTVQYEHQAVKMLFDHNDNYLPQRNATTSGSDEKLMPLSGNEIAPNESTANSSTTTTPTTASPAFSSCRWIRAVRSLAQPIAEGCRGLCLSLARLGADPWPARHWEDYHSGGVHQTRRTRGEGMDKLHFAIVILFLFSSSIVARSYFRF
jgi:hypothetical protein